MTKNTAEKKREEERVHIEVVRQMLTLATSGFGFVAALAWNSLIQSIIETYVKAYLPSSSKIISLALYALIVTLIAVIITLQLSRMLKRLEEDKK